MRIHSSRCLAPFLLLAGLAAPPAATAAESYDACTGFIDSVPAIISTQGTWCLRKDLATSLSSGIAININTSNVTLDCNSFKLGGLGGGTGSTAFGIYIGGVNNATVRNCNVRGFFTGIGKLDVPGDGALVEDNRLDGALATGIMMYGEGHTVRRNRIIDTGASTYANDRSGIFILGDHGVVEDNQIIGVIPSTSSTAAQGIYLNGTSLVVRRNHIAQVAATGGNPSYGIVLAAPAPVLAEGNVLINEASVAGTGISLSMASTCIGNRVSGYTIMAFCQDGGGNVSF